MIIRENSVCKKKQIMFVATTPFAVNSFLLIHIINLSKFYKVFLCVNTDLYPLSSDIPKDVELINIGFSRKISPILDLIALFKLIFIIYQKKPKVVHSITPKAGLLTAIAAFLAFVPIRIHTFTGQVWINKRGFFRTLLIKLDKLIANLCNFIFVDSHSQKNLLLDHQIISSINNVLLLGDGSISGVNLERFNKSELVRSSIRSELGVNIDQVVILFVGRVVKDKGIYDLLHIFSSLRDANENLVLWIVGPDEDGIIENDLHDLICSNSGIVYLGPKSNPEVYMAGADIFTLLSYREGFGSVLIEAAACELPVVAYNVGGVSEAVIDGVTGYLCDKGNSKKAKKLILDLAINNDKRMKMGSAGKLFVNKYFSEEIVASNWLNFYKKIL